MIGRVVIFFYSINELVHTYHTPRSAEENDEDRKKETEGADPALQMQDIRHHQSAFLQIFHMSVLKSSISNLIGSKSIASNYLIGLR